MRKRSKTPDAPRSVGFLRLTHSVRISWADRSGGAALEFALVVPVFLILCMGIVAYGIYFGATNSVQQLAAEAARSSVAGLDDNERISLSTKYVAANAANYPLLRPDKIHVTAQPDENGSNSLIVHVTYDASDLPIWKLAPFVYLPAPRIERVAVIHRGGA